MRHLSAKVHAFYKGLFQPKPRTLALADYQEAARLLEAEGLDSDDTRLALARELADAALLALDADTSADFNATIHRFAENVFRHEELFFLPEYDWSLSHGIAEYWALQDRLKRVRLHLKDVDETKRFITLTFQRVIAPILASIPQPKNDVSENAITVPTEMIHAMTDLPEVVEEMTTTWFADELIEIELFERHRVRLEANVIVASGGNPGDPKNFNRAPKLPRRSDITSPKELIDTYLGGTPAVGLFQQTLGNL